jgi:RHS repeat-associated protein
MLMKDCWPSVRRMGRARTYGSLPGSSTPLFLNQNGEYSWYRTDRLGIPQKLVAANGAVVWSGAYDAFGNCVVGVETVENPLRLPGQYYDAETGLYYNLNRYYDPKTGRYLQPDPAGDGLNPYLYVGGNPVNAVDPNGLCALRMIGGVLEIKAGLALIPGTGGVGTAAAWMIIANGFDNLIAGARGLDGEYKQAGLERVIHWAVPNETAASLLYMGSQIAIPWGGIKLAQWDRIRQQGRYVYRALNVKDAERLKQGLEIEAKNPSGTWSLRRHIVDGSKPTAWQHDPWISTSEDISVALGFNETSKLGVVRIDLSRVKTTAVKAYEMFHDYGKVGREARAYMYSVWQREVSIYQRIPKNAIKWVVR